MKKDTRQRLFEIMERVAPNFTGVSEEGTNEPINNQRYMDKTTIINIKSTISNAKNNIEDIFEKLPIANELSQNEAKILHDAVTVLYDLESKYRYL